MDILRKHTFILLQSDQNEGLFVRDGLVKNVLKSLVVRIVSDT